MGGLVHIPRLVSGLIHEAYDDDSEDDNGEDSGQHSTKCQNMIEENKDPI